MRSFDGNVSRHQLFRLFRFSLSVLLFRDFEAQISPRADPLQGEQGCAELRHREPLPDGVKEEHS